MPRDPIVDEARRIFGFDELLPGQREAIQAAVAGRDVLVVMATGSGKSAIFTLAGRLRTGPTVVVSPLLALQRDQAAPLEEAGLRIGVLNSQISSGDHEATISDLAAGNLDFVYLAPEQLASEEVVDALRRSRVSLVAVDEAHLVSEWGQDFRPDYLRLGPLAEAIGRPPILALTATAAPPVREDIVARLGMRDPEVMVRGFDRPNIFLGVHGFFASDRDKLEALRDDVIEAVAKSGRGIVYAATRQGVEGLAADWRERGVAAVAYHAGLGRRRRLEVERDFADDRQDVVVATVAFGMGIDKADVRWVFHADLAPSLDSYYQEFGRSGRDGSPARAVLYYRPEDVRLPRMYAARSGPSPATVTAVADALQNGARSVEQVVAASGLGRVAVTRAVEALTSTGRVYFGVDGSIDIEPAPYGLATAAEEAVAAVSRRREIERTRVDAMQAYAETSACRRRFLLEYFGEASQDRCGNCDNDDAAGPGQVDSGPWPRGSRVEHATFGPGMILGYTGGEVLVSFETAGYRRLGLDLVQASGLLTPTGRVGPGAPNAQGPGP